MATAGKVDFPEHMKDVHQDWLNDYDGDNDTISSNMVEVMNAALGADPFSAMTAYDPASQLTAMDAAVTAFNTLVDALDYEQDWEDAVDAAVAKADGAVFDDTYINNDISAFGDNLDDQIENIVLPRFQGGMRDVNAVMSSAFVIGESIIEGMRTKDTAKYGTELRIKTSFQRNDFVLKGTEAMLRDNVGRIELEKSVMHYTIESNRLRAVTGKEKLDTENNVDVSDAKWELELFQYGANLLAAIGGGTVIPSGGGGNSGPSKTQSAIGGALSGAAAGGMVGGGWGALVGGALGGLGSLF
jgi:hypothetical protein